MLLVYARKGPVVQPFTQAPSAMCSLPQRCMSWCMHSHQLGKLALRTVPPTGSFQCKQMNSPPVSAPGVCVLGDAIRRTHAQDRAVSLSSAFIVTVRRIQVRAGRRHWAHPTIADATSSERSKSFYYASSSCAVFVNFCATPFASVNQHIYLPSHHFRRNEL